MIEISQELQMEITGKVKKISIEKRNIRPEACYQSSDIVDVELIIRKINSQIDFITLLKSNVLLDRKDLKDFFTKYDYKTFEIECDYNPNHSWNNNEEEYHYTKETILKGLEKKKQYTIKKLFKRGGVYLTSMIESRKKKVIELEEEMNALQNRLDYATMLLKREMPEDN